MQTDSTGNCPECERYIGPVSICPYCSAKNRQSPIIQTIRIVAILLATVGLFMIYMTARHRQPPLVKIESITPAMNFAHVHIVGTVKRKPYISKDQEYISFRIYSESNQSGADLETRSNSSSRAYIRLKSLQVVAHREVAQSLIENNLLPAIGDRVDVRGNLSVSAQSKTKLYLKAHNHLTIIDNPQPDS